MREDGPEIKDDGSSVELSVQECTGLIVEEIIERKEKKCRGQDRIYNMD